MDEEEDGLPILTKKPQTQSEDPGDGLPILKKKPTNYVEKPTDEEDQQLQDFSTQQKRQLEQPFNNTSKPSEKKSEVNLGKYLSETPIIRGVVDLFKSAYSGITDQLPKEYYTQRLRMSKGEFGDLFDRRSDLNAFGDKLPKGISRDEFSKWTGDQNEATRLKSYNERAELFLREKLGDSGFESLKKTFEDENVKERVGFNEEIEQQSKEASLKTRGVVQTIGDIKGASDALSFAGNMIGQAGYRMPLSIFTGSAGSIVSESASVYDRQIDLIAERENISRKEVIEKGLDKPAEGQVVATLLGAMDAVASLGVLGVFKQAAKGEIKKSLLKKAIIAAAGEASTEGIQGEGEELAAAKGADVDYKFDWNRFGTSIAGGLIGGLAGGGGVLLSSPQQDQQSIENAEKMVNDAIDQEQPQATEQIQPVTQDVTVQPVAEPVVQETQTTTKNEIPQPAQEGTEPLGQNAETTPVADGGSQESQEPTTGTGLPPTPDTEQSQEGQESPTMRDKALLNRAFKGADDPEVKASLEKHGLQYEVESFETAKENARAFIDEVGMEAALDAVRKSQVEDGAAAFVWSNVIDDMGAQMAATEDPLEKKQLATAQADLIAEFDRKARSGGRFSSALQEVYATSDFGYSADRQIEQYKAINNGVIAPEVESKFRELETKLNDANAKIKELESNRTQREEQDAIAAAKKDAGKTKTARTKLITAEKKKEITSFFDSLKVDVSGTANDITRVVGSAVWNGSLDAVKAAVLAGADVANAVQAGVKYIQDNFKGEGFVPDEYVQALQPGVEKYVPKPKEKKAPKPQVPSVNKKGNVTIPNSIITDLVEAGVDTIEELTSSIHALMKNDFPDVTERQVRDAITQYGKTRNMSQDEVKKKIRELKRVGKLVSGLEDVQRQMRPLRSGLQRDKLTDKERRMQKELKEAMKDLPVDEDEADNAWRTALDAVKSRLTNQIKDLEDQIATGKKSPKKKGIEYDDEAKALQEERDRLKEIIQATEGKPTMSDEQKTRNAIAAVERRIKEVQKQISDKDIEYKKKKSGPISQELIDKRKELRTLNDTVAKMREEAGVAEKKRLETYKQNIKNRTQEYRDRINNQDFVTPAKKELSLDDEARKLIAQKTKIKEEFEVLQEKNRLDNRPATERYYDYVVDIVNAPKSLQASVDLSAPFRQGAILSAANPRAAGRAFAEMFRQLFSEKRTQQWNDALKNTPEYSVMKDAKLFLSEPSTKLKAKEDQFLSNFAERIPLFGPAVKASSRAYTAYLNKLRTDVFVAGMDQLTSEGYSPKNSPEVYKSFASFINNATGRGELGGTMEMAAPFLNAMFFSPRYLASRINLLNPATYIKMPAPVRKMALKSMITYIGFGTMVLAMAAAAGADVEEDPRSSDFGKIKVGNTRYDIWAGFGQWIRLFTQFFTEERKSTKTGEIIPINKKTFPYKSPVDLFFNFYRSKAAPTISTAWNLKEGENMIGEEATIGSEAIRLVTPLYLQDMYEITKEEGATGLSKVAIPAMFGIGVQNFDPSKKKKKDSKKKEEEQFKVGF